MQEEKSIYSNWYNSSFAYVMKLASSIEMVIQVFRYWWIIVFWMHDIFLPWAKSSLERNTY